MRRKRNVHNRLWRIRRHYKAGNIRFEMFGARGFGGWDASPDAYCNLYVGSINTDDLTKIDERWRGHWVKVGHGVDLDDTVKDAERWIDDGKAQALLDAHWDAGCSQCSSWANGLLLKEKDA